jgi:hypothetical protein
MLNLIIKLAEEVSFYYIYYKYLYTHVIAQKKVRIRNIRVTMYILLIMESFKIHAYQY